MADRQATAEHLRLRSPERESWLNWGPYLSERAWGTVREDYSADGSAWSHFPHDHARSRAYRWNEDGLAGLCDREQNTCFAFAFWNGRDAILKERIFGLDGNEGNHGEDAKETWWYRDATPTASLLEWGYAYPQNRFPYTDLIAENGRRGRHDREYELEDTGIFDASEYWDISVTYAKHDAETICITLTALNAGPTTETLHVLPTLWFRNNWEGSSNPKPHIELVDRALVAKTSAGHAATLIGEGQPTAIFCENETNWARISGASESPGFPKDGINDHVTSGAATVNPEHNGTKAALWYECVVPSGETATIRLILETGSTNSGGLVSWSDGDSDRIDATTDLRRAEADEFYDDVMPNKTSPQDKAIARQAFAGLVWSKQFYAFDVERWLRGDPTSGDPPASRAEIRNTDWCHHFAADVILMPDPWEYPWYAAWDLAFHCIPMAHIDPQFAKEQLLLLCEDRYLHPNGQLPAYEWSFSDVNPPVHAMAALQVYAIDGSRDRAFLSQIFSRLLLNFSWWVNRKDFDDNNVFQGGFLGLDNIGPFDRSEGLPDGYHLDQADGTAWMANYALHMFEIAIELAIEEPVYEDMAKKFFNHFAYIATAMDEQGLWDDESGFYYDVLHGATGVQPVKVRSMVGLLPLCAARSIPVARFTEDTSFAAHVRWFTEQRARFAGNILDGDLVLDCDTTPDCSAILLSVADLDQLRRVLAVMLDPDEFLSPYGLRSLSAAHRDDPFELTIGDDVASVGYEPAESQTSLFGGNSNWRGPVWFPVNHLVIGALRRYALHVGDGFRVEYPTGSGELATLSTIADDLSDRLISLFRVSSDGSMPFADSRGPGWGDRLHFHEYFDGDTGRGLGASHQTGWTALVADLIMRREADELGFVAHELRRRVLEQSRKSALSVS